ncbi:MAG TPA: cyclic nucleotide-binding domain-containing protein [Acetobacteraceae bacterium]|nr:cyclic nucleotide-binding domain-containing protein [Acetobacteraceae bacterium]
MSDDRIGVLRRAFPSADPPSIEALAMVCSVVAVPGGLAVIQQGEQPDAVYIVITGLFAAYRQDVLLGRLGAGDIIGEIGFITGEARTATVRALRDSELLRILQYDLRAAAAHCPGVLLAICSTVVQRLRRAELGSVTPLKPRAFCLAPGDATIDSVAMLEGIARTLQTFGTVTIISPDQAAGRDAAWFSERERCFDYVLYQAGHGLTAWTRFCLRQCDRILLLARGDAAPAGPGPLASHVPKKIAIIAFDVDKAPIQPPP